MIKAKLDGHTGDDGAIGRAGPGEEDAEQAPMQLPQRGGQGSPAVADATGGQPESCKPDCQLIVYDRSVGGIGGPAGLLGA
jgi:hypothetical protein